MKKFLVFLILLSIGSANSAQAFFWKKDKGSALSESTNSGYAGQLPDIEAEFDYLRPQPKASNVMRVDEEAKIEDLIPAPRQEKMYIDIIKKKDKTSNYIHDVNDVILALEKIKVSIIQGVKTQVFNAQVSYFIDLAYHLQREYSDKAESSYISYSKIMELSNLSYNVATLRREASYYGKYLSYSEDGYIYSPEYINEQLQYLLDAINAALPVLKDAE